MKKEEFEMIPKLDGKERPVRTVVFSTDDHYAAPAGVAITSLLQTISQDVFCDVVILDNGISEKNRRRLQEIAGESVRASIRFCDVVDVAADAPVHGQFSKATYLFLFVPYLFRGHEKVLFLDCDIIVRKDVSELFETEFKGEYIAAVRDVGIAEQSQRRTPMLFKGRRTNWSRYATHHLGFSKDQVEDVVNTGMGLFNIPAFEADQFAALDFVERHIRFGYFLVDQCIANILFKGRIKHLHLRWNVQIQRREPARLADWFFKQYREAEDDPAIIHYITHFKPWLRYDVCFQGSFWAVARQTVWFRELQEKQLSDSFTRWLHHTEKPEIQVPSENPLISIIMPVYNRQRQIKRAVRSILQQDFTEFELIIVDDASTDATVEVIRAEMQNDPRIRLVCLETNGGPGPARNAGIAQARGTYIRVCDSDDFYPPGALSVMARRVEHEDFDVVAGNWCRWHALRRFAKIDTENSLITEDQSSSDLRELRPLWSLLHFSRCMFRRDFLLENGIEYPAMRRAEDPVYMARVLSKAKRFALIQDVVFLFHHRPRNQTFSFEEVHNAFSAYQIISEELIAAGFRELAFVFHGFFDSLQFEYDIYTDEEVLELAVLLKKSLENFEISELDNPVFEQCGFDLLKLHHDYWVVKTFSADELVRLMKQGVLCGMADEKKRKIRRLIRENRELLQKLNRLEPLLRVKRGVARRLSKFRRRLKRGWRRRGL